MMIKNVCVLTAAAFLPLLLSSCMFNSREITVREAIGGEKRDYFRNEIINSDGLAFESYNFLSGNLLLSSVRSNPDETLDKLDETIKLTGDIRYMRIAADICRYLALNSSEDEAIQFHLSCFNYCREIITRYRNNPVVTTEFAAHYAQISQNYNEACCGIFTYLKRCGILDADSVRLYGRRGKVFILEKPEYHLSVPRESVTDFSLCSDYVVRDLMQISRTPGLGITLVGRVSSFNAAKPLRVPDGMTIPVTLLLVPTPREDGNLGIRLFYQDTYLSETFCAIPKTQGWPLALDYSTPLACFLNDIQQRNLIGMMLNPGEAEASSGLYMVEPYQPNKIPVLFVHGLMSSPETWVQMINSLKNDPVIRQRYQFWFYAYSSGVPVRMTAFNLRKELLEAQKNLCTTPEATANFNNMVMIGHSMGGMVTRTLLQRDPYFLLEHQTNLSREEIKSKLEPQDWKLVETTWALPALPFVHRAIFMAVPHKGANMAQSPIAMLGIYLIKLPNSIRRNLDAIHRITSALHASQFAKEEMLNDFITGIDNLDPSTSFPQALGISPMKKDLVYHCIIGNHEKALVPGGSDGIVPYWSSHLNDAESELIVKSDHSVHRRPAAIREVQRILRLHLKSIK